MTAASAHTFFATTARTAAVRPPLAHAIEAEVCIVGGGFAGLWAGRMLLERGHEVVLLEAGEVAGGASGRNAGIVAAGFAERLAPIIERVGLGHARSLYRLSRDGVELVRSASGEHADLEVTPGRLEVFRYRGEAEAAAHAEMLARDFDHVLKLWPRSRVRSALLSDRYYLALHEADAFHLQPLNFARLLAAEFEARGGRIYEKSAVVAADLEGVRKTVKTASGSVRAFHVVLAGNVALGAAFPRLARTILPVRSHVAVTEPLGDRAKQAIRFAGAIADTRRGGDYYRLAGDRLVWGGRITTAGHGPRRLAQAMARDIVGVYPQLKGVRVETAWSGTMGYAIHKMPQIGMVRPGVWIASALGGHGLNTAAMAGSLIASAIAERDDRWRLFIPFGVVWAGGTAGRVVTQASYWSARAGDRLDEMRARGIERDEAALGAGLAPGLFAHLARRVAASPVGRMTARLFAGLKRLGCAARAVCSAVAAWLVAILTTILTVIGRVLAPVVGFAGRVLAAGARMMAAAAVSLWRKVLISAAGLVAALWLRRIVPALRRLLQGAQFAGKQSRVAGIGFLRPARRALLPGGVAETATPQMAVPEAKPPEAKHSEAKRSEAQAPEAKADVEAGATLVQTAAVPPAAAAGDRHGAAAGPAKPKRKKKKSKASPDSVGA